MQAIAYIINDYDEKGFPEREGSVPIGKARSLQETKQENTEMQQEEQPSLNRSGSSRTFLSLRRSESKPTLKKNGSLMKVDSNSSWTKVLNSLKKFFAYQYFEKPVDPYRCRVTPRVMLNGCTTKDEHYEHINKILKETRGKFSLEGLEAAGFTYKFIPCEEHASSAVLCPHKTSRHQCACDKRLIHISTNTMITKMNMKTFVADGEMYEQIVRLCQEYAQELMIEEGGLHWVSVCEDLQKGRPIRILVDRNYPIHGSDCHGVDADSVHNNIDFQREEEKLNASFGVGSDNNRDAAAAATDDADEIDTLLITTGKGKVRAGIFSRQHLLISGIESSTALPIIRDAKQRNMSVAILDPNARGDRRGMATYEQSMQVLFGSVQDSAKQTFGSKIGTGPIFILAHSNSGAQLTRYLQTDGEHILPRLKSIAFTDSNHSIQWLKNHSRLSSFFQSPSTIYIRSSNQDRDDGWQNHKCGDECETDEHWKHRFGETNTIWAGTTDHSLTNFTSQDQIWAHFDKCRECHNTLSHNVEFDDATTISSIQTGIL